MEVIYSQPNWQVNIYMKHIFYDQFLYSYYFFNLSNAVLFLTCVYVQGYETQHISVYEKGLRINT